MLSYIEISKENVLHNFQLIRKYINPAAKIICVIKANAYGHGQNEIAQILENNADYFQVDDAQELLLLRKVSQKPALVLGYVAKDEIEETLKAEGILAVYDLEQVSHINNVAKNLGKIALVHVKIDANLGRQGILIENVRDFAEKIKQFENVKVDGIYSHFANIEDTNDFSHAQKQIDVYQKALEIFRAAGCSEIKSHISSTAGTLVYEKDQLKSSLVRLGIGLYGMWPSMELKEKYAKDGFQLRSVARWVTHVAQIKTLPANYFVGYGLTYITNAPTKVAIIPQGYSDGYDRGFSNAGEVLIQGSRCKVLGRVAMNMFVVDVTHLENVQAEDEVVLLGRQGEAEITAEQLAEKIGTINYEVSARLLSTLSRIVK